MRQILFMIVWFTAGTGLASNWAPSESFLMAIRYVESSHGLFVYGDNGKSLGDYQMSEAAWIDVTRFRKAKGQRTYAYRPYVFNRSVSRAYASDYLTILHGELAKKLKRAPTPTEVYAAYNMGMRTFAQCRYNVKRVNPVTARKLEQIKALMAEYGD